MTAWIKSGAFSCAVAVASTLTACHRSAVVVPAPNANAQSAFCWADKQLGVQSPAIFDLPLRSRTENQPPTTADSLAVASRGGRVLHAFSVAVLRVAVDTTLLRALIAGPMAIADIAYRVADTASYNVAVQVFFNRPLRLSDSVAVVRLGGRVSMFRAGGKVPLTASVPDTIVPALRNLVDVTLVRAAAMGCAQLTPASVS